MSDESSGLLKQLTSRREPTETELEELIGRAILGVLRHDDKSTPANHDQFGLLIKNQLQASIEARFRTISEDVLSKCYGKVVDSLIAMEKIEIRGDKIRAMYGHSLRGIIVGEMKWPEVALYHATRKRHLGSILATGLTPRGRTWVHLTGNARYAADILTNHDYEGGSVLLKVIPDLLADCDVTFRKPNSHVWLANHIPPIGIEVWQLNGGSDLSFFIA